jgi:hypothetical protein
MSCIRKSIAFARAAIAAFFGHPALDASDLDFYLFNREARMDEAWESARVCVVGKGSDQIGPDTAPYL